MAELGSEILSFMRSGFSQVNALQGLLIALVAALLMRTWRRLLVFALGATLVHLLVDALIPLLSGASSLRLPEILYLSFWRYVAALYVGYVLVVGLIFLARRLLMRR